MNQKRYELYDDEGNLIRVFDCEENAKKMLTLGDYIKTKTIKVEKETPYEVALRKVGEAPL